MESKVYDPEIVESKWRDVWYANNYHVSKIDDRPPFTILLPPPNVSGTLHLGHSMEHTLQDMIIRVKKLQGYNTLWVPGTDHGGISTESVMKKEVYNKYGKSKEELGREEFIKLVNEWKDDKRSSIVKQMMQLGCLCDWSREQFTMNEHFSKIVTDTFAKLYNDDIVYRDMYIVNWCNVCKTVLADDEVIIDDCNLDNSNKMYYIRYPFLNDPTKYHVVATTRPETMFGDVAVCYNPTDDRYNKSKDKLIIPIINRPINMIADDSIKKDFGSGLVKITPAHDKNDYNISKKHKLPYIVIMDDNNRIQNTNTKYDGMDRLECRQMLVDDLGKLGLLDKVEDYGNSCHKCYRCDSSVEPKLSKQWFLRMNRIKIDENLIDFFPARHKNILVQWLSNNIDWCISRQIWWGHRLPIWYCDMCDYTMCQSINCGHIERCPKCDSLMRQDTDVLDTWFSSALWSFGVFESQEDLDYYFPSTLLVTGSDILFFWVARMMIMASYLKNSIPFKAVYCHGVIRDEKGNKMSKSKGNVISPTDIISRYSVDSLRYTFAASVMHDNDVNISHKSVEVGKTFCTKLWNMMRYITTNISESRSITVENIIVNNIDKWILNKFNNTVKACELALDNFNFAEYTLNLHNFMWNDFCNNYMEFAKSFIQTESVQQMLLLVATNLLVMCHPIIPHITEELFEIVKVKIDEYKDKNIKSILDLKWVQFIDIGVYGEKLDGFYDIYCKIIKNIRSVKNEYQIKCNDVDVTIYSDADLLQYIKENNKPICKLVRINSIKCCQKNDNIPAIQDTIILDDEEFSIHFKIDNSFNIDHKIKALEVTLSNYRKKIDKIENKYKNITSSKKEQKVSNMINDISVFISDIKNRIRVEETRRYHLRTLQIEEL